jgi:glycosyltransferase involved in cell wall biosynthesis
VLCAAAPGDPEPKVDDGVIVYRVRDWLINASTRVTPGAGAPRSSTSGEQNLLRRALQKTIRAIWRAVHWPDYACGWIIPAAKAARELCEANNYDWIISVSHPFTGHVVGILAKAQASKSRWFVDISDPYYLMKEPSPSNRYIYSWISRVIEGRVIAGANAISVTTDSTSRIYEEEFPESIGKIRVIPPLLSLPRIPLPSKRQANHAIRLVFVGTLYKSLRSPNYLLTCVSALKAILPERRLEVHLYGTINDCGDDLANCPVNIKSCLYVHGMVSRAIVVQAMVDADVLVNIGNDSETQLASKVIEYMAVAKPILNLVSVDRDISIDVLADYPAALTIARSGEGPAREVLDALRSFVVDPPQVDKQFADEIRRRYSEECVSGLYESMLKQGISS